MTHGLGFHSPTRAEWERLRRQNAQIVVSCHALMECFSVLTRMPPPYHGPPEVAERLLRENFAQDAEIPGVAAQPVWSAIQNLVAAGIGGGRIYDAVIAHSTFSAGATVLLTWNIRDFLRVAPREMEIVSPADYSGRGSRVH